MIWWAMDVCVDRESRDAVAAWLVAHTGHAVEERSDGALVGFAESEPQARGVEGCLRGSFPYDMRIAIRPVETVDWSTRWRDGMAARRLGRLTVLPTWLPVPQGAEVVVRIDPETAFGTGEHGSTRSALRLMERLVRPGDRVLDLGSGSGILAIAAVKLGARQAIGVELDREAIPVAAANAALNQVEQAVEFIEGDAAALAPLCGPVDLVVSNILRGANVALLPAIRCALVAGGHAVFGGMEAVEAPLFRPELGANGFEVVDDALDEGWWAVASVRR